MTELERILYAYLSGASGDVKTQVAFETALAAYYRAHGDSADAANDKVSQALLSLQSLEPNSYDSKEALAAALAAIPGVRISLSVQEKNILGKLTDDPESVAPVAKELHDYYMEKQGYADTAAWQEAVRQLPPLPKGPSFTQQRANLLAQVRALPDAERADELIQSLHDLHKSQPGISEAAAAQLTQEDLDEVFPPAKAPPEPSFKTTLANFESKLLSGQDTTGEVQRLSDALLASGVDPLLAQGQLRELLAPARIKQIVASPGDYADKVARIAAELEATGVAPGQSQVQARGMLPIQDPRTAPGLLGPFPGGPPPVVTTPAPSLPPFLQMTSAEQARATAGFAQPPPELPEGYWWQPTSADYAVIAGPGGVGLTMEGYPTVWKLTPEPQAPLVPAWQPTPLTPIEVEAKRQLWEVSGQTIPFEDWLALPWNQPEPPAAVVPPSATGFLPGGGAGGMSASFTPSAFTPEELRQRTLFEQSPSQQWASFTARNPFGQLSEAGRSALESRFRPTLAAYNLTTPATTSFADFLKQGGASLSPEGFRQKFAEVGGLFGAPEGTLNPQQLELRERFRSNPEALDAYMSAFLPTVASPFRTSTRNMGEDIYNRYQGETPELPLMQFIAKRGGRLF